MKAQTMQALRTKTNRLEKRKKTDWLYTFAMINNRHQITIFPVLWCSTKKKKKKKKKLIYKWWREWKGKGRAVSCVTCLCSNTFYNHLQHESMHNIEAATVTVTHTHTCIHTHTHLPSQHIHSLNPEVREQNVKINAKYNMMALSNIHRKGKAVWRWGVWPKQLWMNKEHS